MLHRPIDRPADPGETVGSVAVYAINLDRALERWRAFERNFSNLPWPLVRIAALDAAGAPEAILAVRHQKLVSPPTGLGWNPARFRMYSLAEEACFCSHLQALSAFLESGRAFGLILEDDALPQRDVVKDLSLIVGSGVDFDLVKLEGFRHRGSRLAGGEKRLGEISLVRSFEPSSGSAAYLVSRRGARKLIDNAGSLRIPYDDYLNSGVLSRCRVLQLSPWLVWQSEADSTLAPLRAPTRYVRRRDPWHYMLQAGRRGLLRLALWGAAVGRSPRKMFALTRAPW